jgi:NDP-sugar pyrophosphorylase family protein
MVTRYDKRSPDRLEYIDYGLNIFKKQVLKWVPKDVYYPLEEVFHKLIEVRELISFETKERFYEIGSPGGLAEFRKFVAGKRL